MLGAGLLVGSLASCGLSWSGDDSGRLQDGIDEIASVGGPEGQDPTRIEIVGCEDDAEVPAGYAFFDHPGPENSFDVEAANAELAELIDWYRPRWEALGWEFGDGEYPSATKEVGGKRLRASVDAVTTTGYDVHVVREGAGLCS